MTENNIVIIDARNVKNFFVFRPEKEKSIYTAASVETNSGRKHNHKGDDFMNIEYTAEELLMMIVIVSFLGFCIENIWLIFRKGYADNRNMSLPFLLGYGLVVYGFYLCFGIPQEGNEHSYFIVAFIAVSAGEILMGETVEKYFGFYYWDYSSLPMHITRYTSVPTSFGFAVIITFFMKYCFTGLMDSISCIPDFWLVHISKSAFLLLSADMVYSYHIMYADRALNQKWKIQFRKSVLQKAK